MKQVCGLFLAGAAALLAAVPAAAETKVELSGVHLCCGACVKAANKVLAGVEGVAGAADSATESIAFTAKDDAAARAALEALAKAGFYGKSSDGKLPVPQLGQVPAGKVTRLEVVGPHNCCGGCAVALKKAAKGVEGVTAADVDARAKSFVAEGNFEPAALIRALNEAGFSARTKSE